MPFFLLIFIRIIRAFLTEEVKIVKKVIKTKKDKK